MEDELLPFIDETGEERRCGSLMLPKGYVCASPTFESKFEVWDDATIRKVITHPDRVARRVTFGKEWIQNQRSKGSCNGFGTAAAYGKTRYLRGIHDKKLFSGSFVYGCINGGRDNGSALQDGLESVYENGVAEAEYADWDEIYPNQWKPGARENAKKHKGIVRYPAETLQGLRTGLAKGFVAIIAVHAGGNFQRLNSQGIAGVDRGPGNHAVHADDLCMVGGTEVFDHAGSWGLGYGTEGRAYLHKDSFAGTFGNHMFWLIGSTEEAAA